MVASSTKWVLQSAFDTSKVSGTLIKRVFVVCDFYSFSTSDLANLTSLGFSLDFPLVNQRGILRASVDEQMCDENTKFTCLS